MTRGITRRRFVRSAAAATGGLAAGSGTAAKGLTVFAREEGRPALLGGTPIREEPFAEWPVIDDLEEAALLKTLRGRRWYRGQGENAARFEAAYAELTGARHCIATANGTSALYASLAALEVGPGDEVIVPPYTFVATVNAVLLHYALPVFVDSDIETSQIDARKIEAAVTSRTAALLPVHLGGNAADLDTILEVSRRRSVPVLEDACQAHLGEWRGRKLGTLGALGCFSFQASKNLNSGEGGAVLTDDDELAARCWGFHDHSRQRPGSDFQYPDARSANLRLTEFQAALLLAQMTRLEAQSRFREENAAWLSGELERIPGIRATKRYPGCTRNAYHIYMARYDAEAFGGLPRARFLEAMRAEGIPCSGGYTPLNTQPEIAATLASKAFRRLYPERLLEEWAERTRCPVNEQLCQEAVWMGQTTLLGSRSDMEDVVAAVSRVHGAAEALAASA
jgi:dTDP-4-amino-4,6-dideoxygalactose transaminase